jgi:hypothetical protein
MMPLIKQGQQGFNKAMETQYFMTKTRREKLTISYASNKQESLKKFL